MLVERSLPADSLQLEITEEFLMADRDRARTLLTRLRNRVRCGCTDWRPPPADGTEGTTGPRR